MPVRSQLHVRLTRVFAVIGAVALCALAGCGQGPTTPAASTGSQVATQPAGSVASATASAGALHTPAYVPTGNEVAVFKTNKGEIRVKLYGKDAPINTGNFIELARKGFYNGTRFHRLEPGFVLQGGDPQTKKLSKSQVIKFLANQQQGVFKQGDPILGTGGPGYTIKGEFDPNHIVHKHVDGTLAMARTNSPDTAGSQFYFALAPLAELDGNYTVLGDTVQGLKVVHSLGIGDVVKSITIENVTK